MTGEIYADISEHNAALTDAYTRKFVMFRLVNEYGHVDQNAAANLACALKLRAAGKLVNFGGYVNPGYNANSDFLTKIDNLGFPKDAVLMEDVEPWPDSSGQPLLQGDHSSTLSALADSLRARQGGRADLVNGYSYKSALAELWPRRPSWLPFVAASYGSTQPTWVTPLAAWQYTDGAINATSMPSSSAPFGACDHNELLVSIPTATGVEVLDATDPIVVEIRAALDALRPKSAGGDFPITFGQTTVGGSLGVLLKQAGDVHAELTARSLGGNFEIAAGQNSVGGSLSSALYSRLDNLANTVTSSSAGEVSQITAALQAAEADIKAVISTSTTSTGSVDLDAAAKAVVALMATKLGAQ